MTLPPRKVTVLVADDHVAMAAGLTHALGQWFAVEPAVNSLEQLRATLARRSARAPDGSLIVVLDVNFKEVSAIRELPTLTADFPEVRFVMYSADFFEAMVDASLRAGAMGYVDKRCGLTELRAAIDAVAADKQAVYGPDGTTRSGTAPGISPGKDLTPALRRVLLLLQKGKSRREIVTILGISESGVDALIGRLRRAYDPAAWDPIDWKQLRLR
jgi:DNA-binding NarL/FixJ family response regulator